MNCLDKIPKEIKNQYRLREVENMLYIHQPSFIGLKIDSSLKVKILKNIVMIENKVCSIDLSRVSLRTHTTIF